MLSLQPREKYMTWSKVLKEIPECSRSMNSNYERWPEGSQIKFTESWEGDMGACSKINVKYRLKIYEWLNNAGWQDCEV